MSDVGASLRSRGMRMTRQRARILGAVESLGHATPDAIAEVVNADGRPSLAMSTIYRNLEALETLGIVAHAHLDQRAATYHLATHADHLHLICLGCGRATETDVADADDLVSAIRARHGFVADVRHLAISGWCATCATTRSIPT